MKYEVGTYLRCINAGLATIIQVRPTEEYTRSLIGMREDELIAKCIAAPGGCDNEGKLYRYDVDLCIPLTKKEKLEFL